MSSPAFNIRRAYIIAWKIIHAKKPAIHGAMEEEDYVQEMVTHCYLKWDKFDSSRGDEGQFLYAVSINRFYSLVKQASQDASHFAASTLVSPDSGEEVKVVEIVADTQRADPAEKTIAKEMVSKIVKFARRHGIFRADELDRLRASIFQNKVIARDDPTWAKRRKNFSVRRALVMRELALEYAA